MSQFALEYRKVCTRLASLDPIDDRASINQLKNAKSQILQAWKSACSNRYAFKAEVEAEQMHQQSATLSGKEVEAKQAYIENMQRQAKNYDAHLAAGGAK